MNSKILEAANALGVAAPDLKKGAGKTLEATIMLMLAARLREHAVTCQVRTHSGEAADKFVLSGGPCLIPDPHSDGPKPTYLSVEYFGVDLELHSGVQFLGQSGVRHEMDVSLVHRWEVESVRKKGGGALPGCPVLGIEVKEIPAHRRLAKNAIRALMGCKLDLYPGWPLDRISLSYGGPQTHYQVRPRHVRFALVTTGRFSKQSVRLGEFYSLKLFDRIESDDFKCIDELTGWIHTWAAMRSIPES